MMTHQFDHSSIRPVPVMQREVGKISVAGRTPVSYIVFNRPRHTRETFAAIRAYRPSQLFIIADGPREHRPADIEHCREVRRIVSEIDWPCEVHRNFSDRNLGCGRRVSRGLDWVFSLMDRAIVLEDDCLSSLEFFSFCGALLERYRDCKSVWVISGNSYQPEFKRGDGSYYFSNCPDIWGWATWRRVWRHYQHDMPFRVAWQKSARWIEAFTTRSEQAHFRDVFRRALSGMVDTWDYQGVGCVLPGGGLAATPNANLVKNIGFEGGGTHTSNSPVRQGYAITPLGALIHPSRITADVDADEYARRREIPARSRRGLVRRLVERAKLPFHARAIRRN
jgi:hypothetical protein